MKIDLVYLWVDGSEEKWLKKKNAAQEIACKKLSASSARSNRWTDHDELLYSLRSVVKFAPWINHVFVVTDNQNPKWLNLENPKISIVDHKEIVPIEKLPLFNSTAIEMFIWKIPGLSEYFLYANDDMFFGAEVSPDFFFDDKENPIVIMKERNRSFKNLDDHSQVNHRLFSIKAARTIKFVYKHLGIRYNLAYKHAIEPRRKSYMSKCFLEYEQHIMQTSITTFRDVNNMARLLFPLYDNALGQNTIVLNWRTGNKRTDYNYKKDTIVRRFIHELIWLTAAIFGYVQYDCYDKKWNLLLNIKKYRPTLFAINDFSDKGSSFEKANELMNTLFPDKSEFEK